MDFISFYIGRASGEQVNGFWRTNKPKKKLPACCNCRQHESLAITQKKIYFSEFAFAEIVIWQVDSPVVGSQHSYQYRLVYVINQACVFRYDNEQGKGNHVHINDQELPYDFISTDRLIDDFFAQIKQMENTP